MIISWYAVRYMNSVVWSANCRALLCISAAYAVMRCLCVCPSVCPSRSYILSKWIKISLTFFHRRFFIPNGGGDILTGTPPPNGASNAGGPGRFWVYIWLHCPAGPAACNWQQQARFYQCNAAGPPYARKLWHLSLIVSGGVDSRRDELFMTRSLNVTPKTTEQRI